MPLCDLRRPLEEEHDCGTLARGHPVDHGVEIGDQRREGLGGALHSAWRQAQQRAAGYLTKDVESSRILRAIVDVARGSAVLDGPTQDGVALELRLRRREDRAWLTCREREILAQIADGRTVSRIAAGLHISVATVKTHTLHTYAKLGVSDRAAAVAAAMRQGLLE